MVASQFNKISPALNHDLEGFFSMFRHQLENASHLVEGNVNRASIPVSSGFKIINKDVFALEGKGGE